MRCAADRGTSRNSHDGSPAVPEAAARQILGVRIDPATEIPMDVAEAEHFYRCEVCGAWVDCRDLGMVLDHEASAAFSG
jgi:hypothetical protein